uniref:Lipase n=1 Tax=Stomoxys calcitrans TaxID=35570 RepID=A0A1I8PLY8_STOCA
MVCFCTRITRHGYPCEQHTVATSDGYLLTVFRIPQSFSSEGTKHATTPAVILMNCLFGTSDLWIINDPNNGLPFLLANAGYDVWLGNSRGNLYSQDHMSLNSKSQEFWDFSLDEIGQIDVPAIIDYITEKVQQLKLHYVGYSQGGSVFFMMLATKPSYADKIKTSQLLGPGVFMCYGQSPLVKPLAQILGRPFAANFLANMSTHASDKIIRALTTTFCQFPLLADLCGAVMNLLAGWGSPYLNKDILLDFLQTMPATISIRQLMHYFQFLVSCEFRPYDFDVERNMLKYGMSPPAAYNLQNVHLQHPIDIYFSDNDFFVSTRDIEHLFHLLGDRASWHRVIYAKFNHFDFILAKNVREVINDCVLEKMEKYEKRPSKSGFCRHFKNKPF